jgi:TIR domain/SIR2-like domain
MALSLAGTPDLRNAPRPPMTSDIDEDFWEDLLTLIDEGKVIPVIGAGVVTRGDDQSLFYPWLARRVAEMLGIRPEALPADVDLNDVATAHLLNRGAGNALYTRLARILRDECPAPGQSLLDLASVSAFNLYLTTTFDPLLQKALDLVRHGGAGATSVYAFSPGAESTDLPARRRDLPGTTVFHLLGRVSSMADYVVWEEDMLEFIFALNRHMPVMERLGRDLKEHGLLLVGLHFSDWLVRFFLRVSKQERLSTRVHRAYLADGPGDFSPQSLVLFFGAVSPDIHVVRQDPLAFCAELAQRWKARHPATDRPVVLGLPATAPEMPEGAVFVSYAREDEAAVAHLVRDLRAAGCIVWYDRERLQPGQDWHNSLEDEIKKRCGLFLSVISRTTESTRESYYHLERNWAAARAERIAHDEEFYIPVVIDDSPLPATREPRAFYRVQAKCLPGGAVTADFAQRVLDLHRKATNAHS